MKKYLLILIILTLSCQEKNKKHVNIKKPPLEAIDSTTEILDTKNEIPKDIRLFLKQFNDAIHKKDSNLVFEHIKIPLNVFGYLDEDPKFKVSEKPKF